MINITPDIFPYNYFIYNDDDFPYENYLYLLLVKIGNIYRYSPYYIEQENYKNS